MTLPWNGNRLLQFCALAYKASGAEGGSSLEQVIIILARDSNGASHLLARQDWTNIVDPVDQDYVEDVLGDLETRILKDSDNLFEQASALSVGPIVTYAAGPRLGEYPDLVALTGEFDGP